MANIFSRLLGRSPRPDAAPAGSVVDPSPSLLRGSRTGPMVQGSAKPQDEDYTQLPIAGLQNWTVGSIRGAVAGHQVGSFTEGAALAETMVCDARVQAALNGRTKGVTRCRPRVTPAAADKSGLVAKEIKRLHPKVFSKEVVDQIMFWQVFSGFALFAVRWIPTGKGRDQRWVPRLEAWNLRYVYFDQNTQKYVAITASHGVVQIDFRDPNWLLLTPHGYYRGWLRGGIASISMAWVVRSLALRDWARYSEVHGLPIKVAKVPAMADAADKQRFFSLIRNLSAQSTILLPTADGKDSASWDAVLLEAKDRSWEAFPGLIDTCNQEITTYIRGTNLTTEVALGSLAAAKTHREEDSDYAESDAEKMCQAADEWLWWWYCAYNFGDPALTPETHMDPPDSTGMKDFGDGLKALGEGIKAAREAGMMVSIPALAAKFEVTLEGDPAESDVDVTVNPEDEDLDQGDVSPAALPSGES